MIKNRIIDLDFVEHAIVIKAFIKDYKENYKQYLETSHWKDVREDKLKEAKYRCQLCGSIDAELHVHHNTYERIGNEEMSDLIVLCKDCHKKFHNID
jgi:5-methylcytosine-specific restriction endonuclease McrA